MFEAHRQVYTTQKIFNPCMLRIFDIGNYCIQLFRTVCQPNMCVAQHASVLGGCDQGTFRYVSAPKAPALTRRSDTRGTLLPSVCKVANAPNTASLMRPSVT